MNATISGNGTQQNPFLIEEDVMNLYFGESGQVNSEMRTLYALDEIFDEMRNSIDTISKLETATMKPRDHVAPMLTEIYEHWKENVYRKKGRERQGR
jgi:hypothetical protein